MIELVDIRSRVVNVLQDAGFIRWTKTELNNYIHDSLLDLVRTIRLPAVNVSVDVFAAVQEDVGQYLDVVTYSYMDSGNGVIPLPTNLMDVSGGSISGRELPVVTTSEMKRYHSEGSLPLVIKDGEHSITQIFGGNSWSTPGDWKATRGTPLYLVLDQRSSETIRIWPMPSEDLTLLLAGTLRPKRMSDEVPCVYTDSSDPDNEVVRYIVTPLNGWVTGTILIDDAGQELTLDEEDNTLSLDSSNVFALTSDNYQTKCHLDAVWVDTLTFGALERAYLKEHDLRNVEKSEYFRNKKMGMIADVDRSEPLNPASITGGVNFNRLVVRR
jgi:hypothetical protein